MAPPSGLKHWLLASFLAGAQLCSGRFVSFDSKHGLGSLETSPLEIRDASSGLVMNSDCTYACTATTCSGTTTCSATKKRGLVSRFTSSIGPPTHFQVWNETTTVWEVVSEEEYDAAVDRRDLVRRTFATDHSGTWDADDVNKYLPKLASGGDAQFKEVLAIIGPNRVENTISYQRSFAKSAFQIGTNGLHGCTVMTLVSNRAVWMGHFWEVSGMGGNDNLLQTGKSYQTFATNVLYVIDSSLGDKAASATGDAVDFSMFNQKGDNTRLMIMSPGKHNWKPGSGETQADRPLVYKDKVARMVETVSSKVDGVWTKVWSYNRLDYATLPDGTLEGGDADEVDSNARGMAFFQYDGTDITNRRATQYWRLFYELQMYKQNDPKP